MQGIFVFSKISRTALGSNQHPNQRSPGSFPSDKAAAPEGGHLHNMSILRKNGGTSHLSHMFWGVHLGNFTRLEITRQHDIIKEKETCTQKLPRKSCLWVQRRTGWIPQPANSRHIYSNALQKTQEYTPTRWPSSGSHNYFYLSFRFVNSKRPHSMINIRQDKVGHREGKLNKKIHQILSNRKG